MTRFRVWYVLRGTARTIPANLPYSEALAFGERLRAHGWRVRYEVAQ